MDDGRKLHSPRKTDSEEIDTSCEISGCPEICRGPGSTGRIGEKNM